MTHLKRTAFTLIELLVVIAIIGILVGLLLPAIQQVRESGRRTQCLNHLKQMALAALDYHGVHRRFPPGYTFPEMAMWSAYLLPHIEQNQLYESIELDGPWTVDGSANEAALAVYIELFQCPSSGAAEHAPPGEGQGVPGRVPCNYLAGSSGTNNRESGELPYVGMPESDGIFYRNSRTALKDIVDGSSNTLLIGEAIFDYSSWGPDYHDGMEVVDHWYIGTREFLPEYPEHAPDISTEASEALTSTACPINSTFIDGAPINDKELCVSSRHPLGAQAAFADGHARFIDAMIDLEIWSAAGTRFGSERVNIFD